jgi:hypothetical protein
MLNTYLTIVFSYCVLNFISYGLPKVLPFSPIWGLGVGNITFSNINIYFGELPNFSFGWLVWRANQNGPLLNISSNEKEWEKLPSNNLVWLTILKVQVKFILIKKNLNDKTNSTLAMIIFYIYPRLWIGYKISDLHALGMCLKMVY